MNALTVIAEFCIAFALYSAFTSPLWLPGVFFAYGHFQGKFTLRLLFAFVTSECIAFAFWAWVLRQRPG
jgi:hypothetical protein